jgi:Tfp pilus assembly protein PilO
LIWREKRLLLIVLGVLLAANTIFFFTYRVQYQSRLQELDQRREQAESRLQQARAARAAPEQRYASYRRIQSDVQTIYSDRWSTEAQRLTALITEVKRLAVASQLVPKTYSFNRSEHGSECRQHLVHRPGQLPAGAPSHQSPGAVAAVRHHRPDQPELRERSGIDAEPISEDSVP